MLSHTTKVWAINKALLYIYIIIIILYYYIIIYYIVMPRAQSFCVYIQFKKHRQVHGALCLVSPYFSHK